MWIKTKLICVGVAILSVFLVLQLIKSREKSRLQLEPVDVNIYHVEGDCANISFPMHLAADETWLPINIGQTAYVFSAYLDENRSKITIIGALTGSSGSYICQLWYKSKKRSIVKLKEVPAESVILPESHFRKYAAAEFQCSLPNGAVPRHVSVVSQTCAFSLNLINIRNINNKLNYDRNFTVCVAPLNFRYNQVYELVGWMELNIILGANKFVFYNYSSSNNVANVLEWYSKRGLAEIIQWQLPVGVDTFPQTNQPVEIHYFGQVAALNDCLMRNTHTSAFIVALDLDEYIIPHSTNSMSWNDILNEIEGQYDTFIFRCTFFRMEWESNKINIPSMEKVKKYRLITLLKAEREERIFAANSRSKYIARTNAVKQLAIHSVSKLKPDHYKVIEVPPEIALLHHYRNWGEYNDRKARIFDDTVIRKFSELLTKRVENIWLELESVQLEH